MPTLRMWMSFSRLPSQSLVAVCLVAMPGLLLGAGDSGRIIGIVTDPHGGVVAGASLTLTSSGGMLRELAADEQGNFQFEALVPGEYTLTATAHGFTPVTKTLTATPQPMVVDLRFQQLVGQRSVVIVSSTLEPTIERRNTEIYRSALFERDDQLLETLSAGINLGQHEGGGKSLEIRRFGYNMDHGGVNGGLKIVVNDLPQNQASQGHGQGYLGALKALTPELVEEVTILNGPFSAEYGDFSGLGVVQIRTRESLPEPFTLRLQGGSFDALRSFLAYSPKFRNADSFISYEGSYTNGPFLSHLRYKRHNFTGNYTWHKSEGEDIGFKFNFGTNNFNSSGQIPLDLIESGALDRFGAIDPASGGRVRLGTAAAYYRKDFGSGDSFKVDGFLGRSLFDLFSNFTFYLNDPVKGDGIQQHDSRYQQGINTQYMHFYHVAGARALLTVGANFHNNMVNVGLYPSLDRVPLGVAARSYLVFPNIAGYAQQGMDFMNGRVHIEGGLRWDYFNWRNDDRVNPLISGAEGAGRLQPKAAVAFNPSRRIPLKLSINYGRGINTQDARGIVAMPNSPRIATTDFYQAGLAYHFKRFALSADTFLIDRSNEAVYIPDDGTFEFKGPSRSTGYEWKASFQPVRRVTLEGGITQVTNSFFRATSPRQYVESAPHTVANAGVTLSGWRGFFASLRYRCIGSYRLDPLDPHIRASGLDVVDLAVTKRLNHWIDFNFGIDNLTNKIYYETQNYFESRVAPGAPAVSRIHATPGYPFDVTAGVTLRLSSKNR